MIFRKRPTRWEIERSDGVGDSTTVTIDNDGGGEFVAVSGHASFGHILRIDPDEWLVIREAIERAMAIIAEHEAKRSK